MPKDWLNFEYNQPASAADPVYDAWLAENLPRKADLLRMSETWRSFSYRPLVSIVTPVYNPPAVFLKQSIESVMAQVYPNWELCLADDASTHPHVREILQFYAAKDPRIKVVFRSQNGHISVCSNSALELATGEYVGLLDHDDLLTPDALYEVVRLLNQHPEADMIYSDEDKVDEQGKLKEPFFKPSWSPDSLLSRMYTCHFGVYRNKSIKDIGGFRQGYEGSQDYDLVLRLTEKTENIFHIPRILYHWRIHEASASSGVEAKPYAFIAAVKALDDAIARRGELGKAEQIPNLGAYISRYKIIQAQTVSIVFYFQNLGQSVESLGRCLNAICSRTSYVNLEIILAGQKLSENDFLETYSQVLGEFIGQIQYCNVDSNLSLPSVLNHAAQMAKGSYLLFLQNVEPITIDWIEALLEQSQRSSIGCASGLLLRSNQTIWHAGIILDPNDIGKYVYQDFPFENNLGYFGQLISVNNYAALSGACLMCHRSKFEQVNGFTEAAGNFYDIDFCLKLGEKGFYHVFLPHVKLYYHGIVEDEVVVSSPQALNYMQERWGRTLLQDPYYNRNFSRSQPYALKVDGYRYVNDHDFNQLAFRVYDMKFLLQEKQEKLELMRGRLRQKKQEVEQIGQALSAAQQRIAAMETSKFWKIRKSWFEVKKLLNLPSKE